MEQEAPTEATDHHSADGDCRVFTTGDLQTIGTILAAAFNSPVGRRTVRSTIRRLRRTDPTDWWALTNSDGTAIITATRARPAAAWTTAGGLAATPVVLLGAALAIHHWLPLLGLVPILAIGLALRTEGARPIADTIATAKLARHVDWASTQVGVIPAAQGRGVGAALLIAAHQRLQARGENALIVARAGLDGFYTAHAHPVSGHPHLYLIGRPLNEASEDLPRTRDAPAQ